MSTVALEVVNARLAERSCEIYDLPVLIGRGADCAVQLDPENRAISRVHLELVAEAGGIVLINRASNPKATVVEGRALAADERIPIGPESRIRVFDTELRLVADPVVALRFETQGALDATEVLTPSRAIVATAGADGRLVTEVVADLAAYDRGRFEGRLALVFYLDAGEPSCAVVSNPHGDALGLDGAPLDQSALVVEPFDTIEIGRHRVEIRSKDGAAIVCGVPSCRGLNPDGRDVCRLCGAPLVADQRAAALL